MLLAIACLFASAAAGPIITYDQRQDGESNGVIKISNVMFLVAIPSKIPGNIFDYFSKSEKSSSEEHDAIQNRADVRVMEAFVEPSKPYQVDIASDESAESGVSDEVVIAGRRRLGTEEPDVEQDELHLLGATENCGPARVRDSVTLRCKDDPAEATEESETVIPKQTDGKLVVLELLPEPAPVEIPS